MNLTGIEFLLMKTDIIKFGMIVWDDKGPHWLQQENIFINWRKTKK